MIKVGIIGVNEQCSMMIGMMMRDQQQHQLKVTLDISDIQACQNIPVSRTPHVTLLDIGTRGVDTIPEVYRKFPDTNVIVYTHIQDYQIVLDCIKAGAMGYLLKDTCMNEIISGIIATYNGGSVFSPCITRDAVRRVQQRLDSHAVLSYRERQIVDGLRNGLSYKLIGFKYGISLDTVRQYIKRTYKKLNINSKGELMAQFK